MTKLLVSLCLTSVCVSVAYAGGQTKTNPRKQCVAKSKKYRGLDSNVYLKKCLKRIKESTH